MSGLQALLQGALQGLTEFLPISSSGHLSIFQYFTGLSGESGLLFTVLLHLGTLIAVFIAFWKTILELVVEFFHMLGEIFTGRFRLSQANPSQRMILLLIVSLLPLCFFILFKDFYASLSSDNDITVEGLCLIVTGILLTLADRSRKGRKTAREMRFRDALVIGVAQGIAPLPGVSRSGSTVAAGMLMGLDRQYAVTFSFIMGIPAVLGANVLELGEALGSGSFELPLVPVLIGVAAAVVFGIIAIKMVQWVVRTDKFKYFAWYTLALGSVVTVIGIVELLSGHAIQRMLLG
ncbi:MULTISPECIES: undecaprenyl-diphosphate phosphatase [Oscillospiraceae]|uniref:Undecaprenyl-diphosphatase n=1 Tax=Harryflintia acetispora TaxID=1849041 RepID=A0A9X8Y7L8_9FIRM|nr:MULTISPECIES: undecaprenyl-diphosphate phosphatase [Oscillospiraceae]TCL42447.1 undecaprenyl-diphosphatase [Harryflintia acetispora]